MKILSHITDGELYTPEPKDNLSLYPDQLVIHALEVMLNNDRECLPISDRGKCIGILHLKDLLWFLTERNNTQNNDLLYHKFNFDLHTAIQAMEKRSTIKYNHQKG